MIRMVSLTCIFIFIAAFESGIGPLFWVLVNEIFLPEVRENAASLMNLIQWGFNLALSMLFLTMIDNIGLGVTYWIFGGFGIFATVYGFLFLKETKGDGESEITDSSSVNAD
eukprot:TRINITY_DN5938_c0_g1_i1.p2 TRINITY_DN5938_c0_g1~~TRINITY_DN5938_c0_g1_i1.p2  ORF type:complete len:112 (-),score=29.00 TRINITY_DN5938_c0_g1_i1:64-399(-)